MTGVPVINNPAVPELQMPDEYRKGHITFQHFILQNKSNRVYLFIAGIATIVQFVIFKLLYPFADFFSDSYSYIFAANANLDINIWPIGYSWFLRYFHFITTSDTAVVTFQYFFLILSSLIFFFSILYFYKPAKTTSNIIFAFLFFNPLFLYISNYINSDPLFAALSLLWITQLVWILQRPMIYQVVTHGIILYLCFIVRNNAIIYPFISVAAFLLSNHRKSMKFSGIAFGSLLVLLFINHQRNAAFKVIGQKEFSLFTGWQLANNALYVRNHINLDPNDLPSEGAQKVDSFARIFFSKVKPSFNDRIRYYVANFYIREPKSPLKQYLNSYDSSLTDAEYMENWTKATVPFKEYGTYIMKNYPGSYVKYFVGINLRHYFFPPLEKLEEYNIGRDKVGGMAVTWFNYKSPQIKVYSKDAQKTVLKLFPTIFFFLNVCFVASLLWLLFSKQLFKQPKQHRNTIILFALFILANLGFTIFTTMNVLRYQFFPMLIMAAIVFLMIEWSEIGVKTVKTKVYQKQPSL